MIITILEPALDQQQQMIMIVLNIKIKFNLIFTDKRYCNMIIFEKLREVI